MIENGFALAVAAVLTLPVACRTDASSGSPSASASVEAPPPPLDTSWQREPGRPLAAGERAPNFEGIAHTGMRVRLASFLDAPALVYFCPRDATPECTAEAQAYRNLWLRLHERLSMVIGVSGDDRVTHRDFATRERLPFLLVADDSGAIARAFGVPPTEGGPSRTAFLVGKNGAIVRAFSAGAPEARAEEVLAALAPGAP